MRFILALILALNFGAPARAFSDGDKSAVQAAISDQLGAFLVDDAARAYSHAAPGIRTMFPNQDIFMELVKKGYQPVYRSRSHAFGELKETPMGLQQSVDIVDAAGEDWTAVYTLQKQADGSWLIASCTLVKKPGAVA